MKLPCMLSFDIEDWFQVENLRDAVKRNDWVKKELRVIKNTEKILKILDEYNTKATFFILGWIAERVPKLIYKIHKKGHEIASHGYGHELIGLMKKKEFKEDIKKSKKILKDITGEDPIGYRAPNFSITEWAMYILKEEGFKYDSSYFPVKLHARYGSIDMNNEYNRNHSQLIQKIKHDIYEVQIPTLDIFIIKVPWGGGGYFRLFPYWIYKRGVKGILKDKGSFVFYLHPWEIDPEQPKVKGIKLGYKLRHYYGLNKTEYKLKKLLNDFKFIPIKEGLRKLNLL